MRAFVQRIHFPDSFSYWLNEMIKMIVVFVSTSHWPHIKSPPRGSFTKLDVPLTQRSDGFSHQQLMARGHTAGSSSSTCSDRAGRPGRGPLAGPFHSSTLGIAHTQRSGPDSGPTARLACVLTLTPILCGLGFHVRLTHAEHFFPDLWLP